MDMNKKIAIPVRGKNFCPHFGESDEFAILEISGERILREEYVAPPPHKPGVFSRWLVEKGVTHVIAGGMGKRALDHFQHNGVIPIVGVANKPVAELVQDFINDRLISGINNCSH